MRAYEFINEIDSVVQSEYNPKLRDFELSNQARSNILKTMKPLRNSEYEYSIIISGDGVYIIIIDPKDLSHSVGAIKLYPSVEFPKNTMQVWSVSVNPKYRNQGISKALYDIALLPKPYGLGTTLISDAAQTLGGRRNWVSLSKRPNVEVTGLIMIKKTDQESADVMADLLGKVGGVYYDETYEYYHYQIPVSVLGTKLENSIRQSLIKIYHKSPRTNPQYRSFLMAKYIA